MVHAPSARLRPVSGVRRCDRCDKRNLERYLGSTRFRHRPLALAAIVITALAVNQRFRCQHAAILSQLTGTSAPPNTRPRGTSSRPSSLSYRTPSPTILAHLQSTDLELTTSSDLCRGETPLPNISTSLFNLSRFLGFSSYLVQTQPASSSTGYDQTLVQHVLLWEEEGGCIQLHLRRQSHRQTGPVPSRSLDNNTSRQRLLLR